MADVREYWPDVLKNVKEFNLIADVENQEIDALKQEIENVLNDQYIETATERGISRRESMLNITPYPDDTLETRRFRVAGKWLNRLPYTRRMLRERLDAILGAGHYELEIIKDPKTIKVLIELTVKRQFDEVYEMLDDMTPQNMILIVQLRYNQHQTVAQFTHGALAVYRHIDIREEVLA